MKNKTTNNFRTRATQFTPKSFRAEDSSVEFVLSTETPSQVLDWERGEVVPEVLVAEGVVLPNSGIIPLQDSHNISSIDANLGSVRDIQVKAGKVIGRLYFDTNDPKAIKALGKVEAKHIDSGSVGYQPIISRWIEKGDVTEHNGKKYKGPLLLTTKWSLGEYSLVAIGADPNAKARSENTVEDSDSAEKNKENKTNMSKEPEAITKPVEAVTETERKASELLTIAERKLAEAERKQADITIRALCIQHNCPELEQELVQRKATIEQAQDAILSKLASRNIAVSPAQAPTIEMGETHGEKLRDAIVDGLLLRGLPGTISKPAEGASEFRTKSLLEIGRDSLDRQGISTRGKSKEEVARMLILNTRNAVASDLTTASFASLTENVLNKSLMRGFEMQQHVWDSICSIGSVPDFKTASRVGLSENADLPIKLEGGEYRESKFADRKESGTVATYADKTTLTEEAIINDDTSALMQIPLRKGAAAMRVPEALLFAAINTPPTLNATSKAWFDATNTVANDITQADGLNSTNLSIARATMRKMPAHKSSAETVTDYYDLMPRVLLVHPDYEDTAKILTQSISLPQTSMSSGVYNPNSDANLIVRSSARITTAAQFFLFADPNLFPVCEMLFLNGRVAPESFLDTSTNIDGLTYRVRMRCGLIVLEWRTAIRHRSA